MRGFFDSLRSLRMTVNWGGGMERGRFCGGEIGREGFASGMQGTGNREQARAVREGVASEWLPHSCDEAA